MELIVEREKERNFVLKHLSHHFEKKKKEEIVKFSENKRWNIKSNSSTWN